jgi:hypothetical protein
MGAMVASAMKAIEITRSWQPRSIIGLAFDVAQYEAETDLG